MTKQISLGELDQIKRFMGLTFSVHDGEALSALRKTNEVLKKHGLTWAEVLGRSVTAGSTGIEPANEMSIETQIRKAFDELRGNVFGSFKEFVASLEAQFEEKRYLS